MINKINVVFFFFLVSTLFIAVSDVKAQFPDMILNQKTETLKLGYGIDYEILQYKDADGNAAGMAIDILRLALLELKIPYEFVPVKRGEAPPTDLDMTLTFTANEPFDAEKNRSIEYYSAPLLLYSHIKQKKNHPISVVGTFSYLTEDYNKVTSLPLFKFTLLQFDTENEMIASFDKGNLTHMLLPSTNIEKTLDHFAGIPFQIEATDVMFPFRVRFADHISDDFIAQLANELKHISTNYTDIAAVYLTNAQKFASPTTFSYFVQRYIGILLTVLVLLLIIGFILIFRIRKIKTAETERKLNYDATTGLYTLHKFKQEVAKVLETAKSNEHMLVSLDIDNFGFVTDLYGLDSREVILHYAAESLKQVVSPDTGLVCHEQSDKFLILSRSIDLSSISLISQSFATKTLDEITGQRVLEDRYLTWHIGVYYIDDTKQMFHSMYENAVMARNSKEHMYGNTVAVYTYNMEIEKAHKINISSKMQSALLNHEFKPHFQPKINIQTGEIVGAEILARWYSSGGIIVPDKFIPIFEKNGFINRLDMYMFEQVCKHINELPKTLRLSVNMSRATLVVPTLIEDLLEIVNRYEISPSLIELEVTESIYAKNKKQLTLVLEKLRDSGFCISLDDFGSEYSSLTSLYDFSPDVVKFDKSFVKMMNTDSGLELTSSLITALHKTYYTVVVEGVETKEDMVQLKELGADIVQGFYFSKPLPIEGFLEFIKSFDEHKLITL